MTDALNNMTTKKRPKDPQVAAREQEALKLLLAGCRLKTVARKVGLSPSGARHAAGRALKSVLAEHRVNAQAIEGEASPVAPAAMLGVVRPLKT
jgi:DNA-binding CsgD family transcriptional regulator